MRELPEGWAEAIVVDLLLSISNGIPNKQNKEAKGIPVTRIETIATGKIDFSRVGFVENTDSYVIERFRLKEGDILFSHINSLAHIGKTALFVEESKELFHGTNLLLLRPDTSITIPSFLEYGFQFLRNLHFFRLNAQNAVNQASLNQKQLKSIGIPLPPLNEQKRIADRLDQLLTRIDKTKAHLDRIPPLLKRFRQSVLAVATSGKLTEEWREDNGEQDSSSKFPLDWNLKLVKEVGNVQLGRQRSPKYHSGQYMRPYLRVQNVFENFIDLDDVMEMNFPPPDMEKYRLCYGDILLNEGQSPHLLGRPAMFRDGLPEAYFTNTLIRFQAFDVVSREFALLVFRNYMHCGRFQHEGTITTNIAHLGAGRFAEIEFPVPSLEEQQEIVRRVEALFAKADRIEAQYKNARQQVDRLTPALLAKAFRGELVPQDPNDEPASVLLERVKEARSATQPAKAKRKTVK